MVRRLFGLLVPFLGSAGALYLATLIFDGDPLEKVVWLGVEDDRQAVAQTLALVTVLFGLVNLLVKPVVRLFTFPIRILSFGLFSLVINGGLLLLTGYLAELPQVNLPFHVELTPWVIAAAAFIGIVSGILNWIGDRISSRTRTKVVKEVQVVERVVERVIERQVPAPAPRPQPRPAPRPQYSAPPAPAPQYSPPPASPQYTPPTAPPQYGPPSQPGYGQGGGYSSGGQGSTYGSDQGGPYGSGGQGPTYGSGTTYGSGQS